MFVEDLTKVCVFVCVGSVAVFVVETERQPQAFSRVEWPAAEPLLYSLVQLFSQHLPAPNGVCTRFPFSPSSDVDVWGFGGNRKQTRIAQQTVCASI
jgi:hypothetical protein